MDRSGRTMAGLRTLFALLALTACAPFAAAQKDDLGLDLGLPGFGEETAGAKVSAALAEDVARPGEAILSVKITTTGKSNTYGNDATSPYKTKLILPALDGLTAIGELKADHEPKIAFDEVQQKKVGKYVGEVTFLQRFAIKPGLTGKVTAEGKIDFLFCNESNCIPKKEKFSASFDRTAEQAAAAPAVAAASEVPPPVDDVPAPVANESTPPAEVAKAPYKPGPLSCEYQVEVPFRGVEAKPVKATLKLCPQDAKAGETVTLTISLALKADWHTYSIREGEGSPTSIELDAIEGLEPVGDFKESPEPLVKKVEGKDSFNFYNKVEWTREFKRVGDQPIGLSGSFRIQVCEGTKQCLAPKKQVFAFGTAQTQENMKDAARPGASGTDTGPAGKVPDAPLQANAPDFQGTQFEIEEEESTTVWGALAFAFIGGLTLNIMPCVLPVLAIKILSIVQQAGESRGRILLMNIVYTIGVVSVFALLATLAAFFSLGWGAQFQKEWFRVATVLVVFVCGLNLLGVFEVLLPGMLSQAAGGGDHREGYLGAFMTGIFATLLATPCSTGYMTYALAWSVKQPTPIIYLVWCTMGLGMALPYLLIGIFPWMIRFLPRPGMWMVQFKQASAFAMFGAAVWFLMALDQRNVLPVLTACVGLGLGLWMIGSLYDRESSLRRKSIVRTTALITTSAICVLAFRLHTAATAPPPESELPWVAFDQSKLIELRKSGKPILIDFTADWCAICKQNEHFALNTINTKELVKKYELTTMVADFTDQSEDIQRWLSHFRSISVPLTVVVPPNPDAKVIRLTGAFSEADLRKTIERAMQKKAAAGNAAMANEAPRKVASKE
ncbi:MAG TPA: cytochrome c biogenesis protein CcdA [Caulifigura sp.]|nr:cytochrome c biogenesis protein CcdA [Caulifigura sp.]